MSVCCTVCFDPLQDRPEVLEEGVELITVALRCGHLFHRVCVEQWFEAKNGEALCPFCQEQADLIDALRIFPNIDEEKRKYEVEIQFQNEVAEHDELKLKYGEILSKMQDLEKKLEEMEELQKVFQASVNTATCEWEQRNLTAQEEIQKLEATVEALKKTSIAGEPRIGGGGGDQGSFNFVTRLDPTHYYCYGRAQGDSLENSDEDQDQSSWEEGGTNVTDLDNGDRGDWEDVEENDPGNYEDEEPEPSNYGDNEVGPNDFEADEPEPDIYVGGGLEPDVYEDSEPEPDIYEDVEPEPDVYEDNEVGPNEFEDGEPEPDIIYEDVEPEPDVYDGGEPDEPGVFEGGEPEPEIYFDLENADVDNFADYDHYVDWGDDDEFNNDYGNDNDDYDW